MKFFKESLLAHDLPTKFFPLVIMDRTGYCIIYKVVASLKIGIIEKESKGKD